MVAKVYDLIKNYNQPQFEAPVLKTFRPNGDYEISIGQIRIVMGIADKQNLIKEWSLCEKLIAEWRALGNVADYSDEAFMKFMADGHNAA